MHLKLVALLLFLHGPNRIFIFQKFNYFTKFFNFCLNLYKTPNFRYLNVKKFLTTKLCKMWPPWDNLRTFEAPSAAFVAFAAHKVVWVWACPRESVWLQVCYRLDTRYIGKTFEKLGSFMGPPKLWNVLR